MIRRDDDRSPAAQLLSVYVSEPLPGVSSDFAVAARRALHEGQDQERQTEPRRVEVDGDDVRDRYAQCHQSLACPRLGRDLRRRAGLEHDLAPSTRSTAKS